MKKKTLALLLSLTFIICGCSHIAKNLPEEKSVAQKQSPSNASTLIYQEIRSKIEKEYLGIKLLSNKEYLDKLERMQKNIDSEINRLWRILSTIGLIIAIFGFFGFSNLMELFKSIRTAKSHLDNTNALYKSMEKIILEQSQELEERYGFLLDPGARKKSYSTIDENKFLNYDHQLYFMPIFLPITKNYSLYKNSLLKLGIFFVWQHNYARAILRFEEIERIAMIEHKIITDDGQILGDKTDVFFNAYGNACSYYAENKCKEGSPECNIYLDRAEGYYIRATKINKYDFRPYYNLGLLYAVDKNNYGKALQCYQSVLQYAKEADDIYSTKWNISCCKARRGDSVSEILEPLRDIPKSHSFWPEIQKDAVLDPIKNTPEWRALIDEKTSTT